MATVTFKLLERPVGFNNIRLEIDNNTHVIVTLYSSNPNKITIHKIEIVRSLPPDGLAKISVRGGYRIVDHLSVGIIYSNIRDCLEPLIRIGQTAEIVINNIQVVNDAPPPFINMKLLFDKCTLKIDEDTYTLVPQTYVPYEDGPREVLTAICVDTGPTSAGARARRRAKVGARDGGGGGEQALAVQAPGGGGGGVAPFVGAAAGAGLIPDAALNDRLAPEAARRKAAKEERIAARKAGAPGGGYGWLVGVDGVLIPPARYGAAPGGGGGAAPGGGGGAPGGGGAAPGGGGNYQQKYLKYKHKYLELKDQHFYN